MKVLTAAFLLVATPASALSTAITVEHAWVRATEPGATIAAVYRTLLSIPGDSLTAVSSPVATSAVVVITLMKGGQSSPYDYRQPYALPAHQPVVLSPDGTHIRLAGLTQTLVAGDKISLALTFAKAGTITVDVPVEAIGATGPAK